MIGGAGKQKKPLLVVMLREGDTLPWPPATPVFPALFSWREGAQSGDVPNRQAAAICTLLAFLQRPIIPSSAHFELKPINDGHGFQSPL